LKLRWIKFWRCHWYLWNKSVFFGLNSIHYFLSLIIENDGWSQREVANRLFLFHKAAVCLNWPSNRTRKEKGMMFIHHPLISFVVVVVRSLRMKEKEQWHGSLLSLSFRGHWSRPTDGSRQKKKTNANRLSKESNTLTARQHCRRQEKEKRRRKQN